MCCAVSLSHVQLFDTPWTVACQVPMSILQVRILEWVACPFSRGSSWPRNPTGVSCIAGWFFTSWVTREAHYKWIHTHTHIYLSLVSLKCISLHLIVMNEWNLPLDILSIRCIWNEFETLSGSTVNMLTCAHNYACVAKFYKCFCTMEWSIISLVHQAQLLNKLQLKPFVLWICFCSSCCDIIMKLKSIFF